MAPGIERPWTGRIILRVYTPHVAKGDLYRRRTSIGDGKLISTSLARIAVGVAIERRKAKSAWADFLWRPVSVFAGEPSAAPWTPIGGEGEAMLF